MFLAEIMPNQLAASLDNGRVVSLTRFERAVPFVAFPRASLDSEFLHAFAFRENCKQNLEQVKALFCGSGTRQEFRDTFRILAVKYTKDLAASGTIEPPSLKVDKQNRPRLLNNSQAFPVRIAPQQLRPKELENKQPI